MNCFIIEHSREAFHAFQNRISQGIRAQNKRRKMRIQKRMQQQSFDAKTEEA